VLGRRDRPTPALVVRQDGSGAPVYEAKWRSKGRQVKRRVGPAWLESDGVGGWRPKRGRVPDGSFDARRAAVRAAELVDQVAAEEDAEARAASLAARKPLTFRAMAAEWLQWAIEVKGISPATARDHQVQLREPGTRHARGDRTSAGRIMARFGDRDVRDISAREVSAFLRELDGTGISPRTVNKTRQLLANVFVYASREDTYGLDHNPVAKTDKRREPLPAALEYFEVHEVELLCETIAAGRHRKPLKHDVGIGEQMARAEEDARDADAFRVLLFTGMRLGEMRALRWSDVDLQARMIMVRRTVSAGVEKEPKGRRFRPVPLAGPAVEVLSRLAARPDFASPDDYVFCGRLGERLDDSALRRRYKAGCEAAGLRSVKLHGLRHAAGSLVARNSSPVEVRDFLGHRHMTTTDRYISAKFSDDYFERLDEAFADGRNAESTAPSASE
jgi:integrase